MYEQLYNVLVVLAAIQVTTQLDKNSSGDEIYRERELFKKKFTFAISSPDEFLSVLPAMYTVCTRLWTAVYYTAVTTAIRPCTRAINTAVLKARTRPAQGRVQALFCARPSSPVMYGRVHGTYTAVYTGRKHIQRRRPCTRQCTCRRPCLRRMYTARTGR